jgi:hypothetical protein
VRATGDRVRFEKESPCPQTFSRSCACSEGSCSCSPALRARAASPGLGATSAEAGAKTITDGTAPTGDAGEAKLGDPSLEVKLSVFDAHAERSVAFLIAWLTDHAPDLIAVARGRHVTGHLLYGDRNFLEYSDERLLAETAEEVADAIVYVSRYLHRTNP